MSYNALCNVSIHAPARGATQNGTPPHFRYYSFNPRTRTGCDSIATPMQMQPKVSIHAPARGATSFTSVMDNEKMFQSTHPHGVRLNHELLKGVVRRFQSTHPHGVRQRGWHYLSTHPCFNPRTRTGCDIFRRIDVTHQLDVSIHAPARGATHD